MVLCSYLRKTTWNIWIIVKWVFRLLKKLIIYQSWLGTIIISSFPKLYHAIMICLTVHFCEEKSFGDRKKTGKRNNNSIIKLRMEMHQSFFIFWSSSSLLRKRFGTKNWENNFCHFAKKEWKKKKKTKPGILGRQNFWS